MHWLTDMPPRLLHAHCDRLPVSRLRESPHAISSKLNTRITSSQDGSLCIKHTMRGPAQGGCSASAPPRFLFFFLRLGPPGSRQAGARAPAAALGGSLNAPARPSPSLAESPSGSSPGPHMPALDTLYSDPLAFCS